MPERRGPKLPYPLAADEAAVLAMARQRQAEDVRILLGWLLRFLQLGRSKSRPAAMDSLLPFR